MQGTDSGEAGPRTLAENLRLLVPLGAAHMTAYLFLNHVQFFPSRRLALTALDEAAPFLLWTVWPYLILVGPVTAAALSIRDREVFRRALRAYVVAFALAVPFYLFLPTHYPRPPAPQAGGLSAFAYRTLVSIDTPENAFPSGHVILPVLCAWASCRDGRRWGPALALFVALALPSILTTKQHYVWDAVGGLACVAIGLAVSQFPLERVFRFRA